MPAQTLSHSQLLIIVLAQFTGTSLWFAGNAILPDLQPLLHAPGLNGWITSAVQTGFISGTLLFAWLALPDRFPTTHLFLVSVVLAALANIGWLMLPLQAEPVLVSRFLTGFFLAGVYPVGMKIAADWFQPVLSRAMGFLVGALVLGTAFPHWLRGLGTTLPYRTLLLLVSGLAVAGGLLLAAVIPSKPVLGTPGRFRFDTLKLLGRPSALRVAMLGYFGHMWEVYTLWAFLPLLITLYGQHHPALGLNTSIWTFGAIGAGLLGCVGGGYWALRAGSAPVARYLLLTSGLCIGLVPGMLSAPPLLFGLFLFVWGAAAAGDSPQFSALVARLAPAENRGSLLTLVTCFGFLLTVVSIQTMAWLIGRFTLSGWLFYMLLPGPMLGVWAMRRGVQPDWAGAQNGTLHPPKENRLP